MFKHYKQQRVSAFTPVIRYSSNGQLLFRNTRFSLAWCYVYFLPTLSLPLTCVASSLRVLWHLSRGLAVSETAPFHHTYDWSRAGKLLTGVTKNVYGHRSHESSLLVLSDFHCIVLRWSFLCNTFLIRKPWPVIEIAAGRRGQDTRTRLQVSKGSSGTSNSFYYGYTAWEKVAPPPWLPAAACIGKCLSESWLRAAPVRCG